MLGFWFFMLLMDLLIPAVMIVCGTIFVRRPPRHIQLFYGYRTAMSMKNQATWEFAHRYCGRLWQKLGWGCLPVTVFPFLFTLHADIAAIGMVGGAVCCVQLLALAVSIVGTERALRKAFDKNGRPRVA